VLDRAEFKGVTNAETPLACLSAKDVAFAIVSILSEPWKYANKVLMQPGTQYTALRLAESFGNALGGCFVCFVVSCIIIIVVVVVVVVVVIVVGLYCLLFATCCLW